MSYNLGGITLPLYLRWTLYAYPCGNSLGWFQTTHAHEVTWHIVMYSATRSQEKHTIFPVKITFWFNTIALSSLGYIRDVCEVRVTSRSIFKHFLIDKIRILSLLPWCFSHEPRMRPWNVMIETKPWPWLDQIEGKTRQCVWNEKGKTLNPRSKLNNEHTMIGPHEAIPYSPMINWKNKEKT